MTVGVNRGGQVVGFADRGGSRGYGIQLRERCFPAWVKDRQAVYLRNEKAPAHPPGPCHSSFRLNTERARRDSNPQPSDP